MQTTVNTMKQASHYLLLCVLLCVGLSSCHKDIEESGETTTTQITQVDIDQLTQGDIAGYIYDESGAPLADVDVSVLGQSTRTNQYGVYVFRNINLDKNGTYIKANKPGYILGSDMIYPDKADVNYSRIKMIELTSNTTVSGANGGNIVVQGGGIISFPANGIVNADGGIHSGAVVVTAERIAADDPDLADVMPGGLVAMDKDGYTRVLGTLGMVAVELRDADGNELNLADGMQATVQFPIAQRQQAEAPDQIALWSFDEDRGLWIEEGFAIREGNNYVGEVSHFSFWNCDAPFPLIHICGTVLNADGTPAANLYVEVMADVIYSTGYGITDSDGRFCGKMPKDKELTITIWYPGCGQEGYTYTVGPFDSDTELDPVTLPNSQNGLLTGTVYCDGNPVNDGTVVININGHTLIYLTDENGNYTFNPAIFGCDEVGPGTIFAFNNESNEASSTQEFDITEDLSIDLNTCGGCDMTLTTSTGSVDPCNIESYFASVDVQDANGAVTYSWSNGATTEVIENINSGLYCVTVTDVEGCEEISCVQFQFFGLGDSLVVNNASCMMDNGGLSSNPFGGTAPYQYQISNEAGNVISTESEIADLPVGIYTVLVTDANGCTVETTEEITESAGIPEFGFVFSCGVTQLVLNSQTSNVTITLDGVETLNNAWVYETGNYCFDLVHVNTGCTETRCLDIDVIEENPYQVEIGCDFPNYIIEWGDFFVESATFTNIDDANLVFQQEQVFSLSVNPLQYGYSGFLQLQQDLGPCLYTEEINLPSFKGLSATGNSPSCSDCEDGFIEIIVDSDADCFGCVSGQVEIYSTVDALFENELSMENDSQTMTTGAYYVIMKDNSSGCIIAHERIEL